MPTKQHQWFRAWSQPLAESAHLFVQFIAACFWLVEVSSNEIEIRICFMWSMRTAAGWLDSISGRCRCRRFRDWRQQSSCHHGTLPVTLSSLSDMKWPSTHISSAKKQKQTKNAAAVAVGFGFSCSSAKKLNSNSGVGDKNRVHTQLHGYF